VITQAVLLTVSVITNVVMLQMHTSGTVASRLEAFWARIHMGQPMETQLPIINFATVVKFVLSTAHARSLTAQN
jgi:hypothetical protein